MPTEPTAPTRLPPLEQLRSWLSVTFDRGDALYVAVAVFASAPAWIVRHPPLQDLPFHEATLRVVHSFHDPAFGLDGTYFINVWRTQYAFYYVLGDVLSYILGVKAATIGLMSIYLGGTLLAVRYLLRTLGKDERLCLFVMPLLVNVMFMMGLLPYVLGIPLMFWALALAVKDIEAPTPVRGVGLGILAVALFYAHVVHYFLFGLGYAALFPWGDLFGRGTVKERLDRLVRAALPVVPSLFSVLLWARVSAQGQQSSGALRETFNDAAPLAESLGHAHSWIEDVFRDSSDEYWFIAWIVVVLITAGLAQGTPDTAKKAARYLVVIPAACVLLYFSSGSSLGDVWLFCERFPVPGLLALVPLMRMPAGLPGKIATLLIAAVSVGSITNTCKHFIRFETEEVGPLDEAIEHMDPRAHVAGLIYDSGSAVVNQAPFLHYVSWYQVEKGGVVQFSNAGALYWPVRFRDGQYPPPGQRPRLRWEWTPQQVPVRGELYPYYDYVLTRGAGFNPPPDTFHSIWSGGRWTVWKKS